MGSVTFEPFQVVLNCIMVDKQDPVAEKVILTDVDATILYCEQVLNGRWDAAEITFADDPAFCFMYARDVIKGRFVERESTLATDSDYSLAYAIDILSGRFKEGENSIAADGTFLCHLDYVDKAVKDTCYWIIT